MSTRPNRYAFVLSIFLMTLVVALSLVVQLIGQDGAARWVEALIGGDSGKSRIEEMVPVGNDDPLNDLADSNSYVFATTTAGSLTDMSTGTTQVLAGNIDDTASGVRDIGFEFYFMSVRYTTFAVNDNGVVRLGANSQTSTPYQPLAQAAIPIITAYGADQRTHTGDGKVHYKVIGSAPNRTLVIEWLNMQSNFNTGGTADLTYQVRINESTGVIEYVYGSMTMSTLGAADVNSNDPHIGYSSSNVANTVGSVTAPQAGSPTFNGTSNDPTENLYTAGAITVLTSASDGTRRTMSFTPPVPAAPTGLNFTGVTGSSITLNWTDSADEDLYGIYRSTDGTNYSFLGTAIENATSFIDATGFPGTTYFYRVFAVSEGALSTALSGSQATNPAGSDVCVGAGGNWNTPATWMDGSVPTAADNVTIPSGCTVTIDSSNALTVTIQSGGVLQFEDTTARTLTVMDDVTIDAGGILRSGGGGIQTGHVLSVGGDLTNNGTIDFSTNTNTAAAGITFTGAANASFTLGGSSTTDLKQTGGVTVNKGTNNTSVLSFSPGGTLTVAGANTAGFLTITNGTFKMDGSGTFSNPLFSVAAYAVPSTGGLWMNNANATVVGQNGSPTVTGRFQMTLGTFNVGTSTGNSIGFASGSNILVEGGSINTTGRFNVTASGNAITYNQTGGTVTTCTIGHTSTTLACFDLGTGVGTTNISAGDIVIQNASTAASGPRDYRNQSSLTGTTTVTGGTVQFGNANTAAAPQAFDVAGVFPNVVVTNTTGNHTVTLLAPAVFNNITRNITINSGTTFNIGNNVFLLNGTTLTNNGTLTANGASSNFVVFLTGAVVTYTGAGSVTSPMTNLAIQADGGSFTIDPATSGITANAVRLFSGNIINADELTIGSGGTTTATVQIGNTTTPTNAGTFDAAPTFNPGTGGTIFSYLRTGGSRTTGPEVPASRSITRLTYDDNTVGRTLTIAGGDLTMTDVATALALTNGRVVTGANTLILSSGTAAVTRTTGFVDGNLNKTFAAAANKNFEVGTANGYSPVAANVTAGTFPATLTVKSVQGAHPAFGTPGLALGRYWSLTEGGDLTADLTFNYLDPTDIPVTANENNFVIFKHDGSFTMPGGVVTPASNTASITGVSSFSDWTLAEPGATSSPGTLAFSAATYNIGEAGPSVTLTVNRTGGSSGTVTVDYTLAGGTATGGGSCAAGVDYHDVATTLSFANGETSKNIVVTVCEDSVFEGDETFLGTLLNPTGGATIGMPNPATVTITDNETQPTVQFSSATYMTTEPLADSAGGTGISISVTLSGASQSPISVNYATVAGGTATGGAACGPGVDYLNASGTVNFPANTVNGNFFVETCADTTFEGDETVNLALTMPVGATLGTPNTAVLTIVENDSGNVVVNPNTASYGTLKEAFDAINAGTHTGAVTVDINGNTTETASAILNNSGAGSANYTSVVIAPTGGPRVIEGSIVGAVVKLNGADNVTIDGRIGGVGRNLTIRNNSTATATAALWLASVVADNGASNNVIRNLEIAAGATANVNANSTFGVYMGGTTISLTATTGNDNDNNQFIANRIIKARYGLATRGVTTNNSLGLVITDNIIGPTSFGPDEIGKAGIYLQADTGAVVSRNTVQFVGGDFANTLAGADRCGICVGDENWTVTTTTTITSGDYTVTRNIVHDIVEDRTFSSMGIRIGTTRGGSATNNLVANNFIYNIRANATSPDQVVGLGYSGGHTDRIVFNSISITGDMDPAPGTSSTIFGAAIRISAANTASHANLLMADNSIFMDASSNLTTTHYYAISAPSNAYSFGTGALNYNNYYVNQANPQMLTGGLATAAAPAATTEFQTLANWQTAFTAAQDPNSIQADPQYVSNTGDLHILPASPNVNTGLTIAGVAEDIDAETRPSGPNPEIGADEVISAVPGTLQFSSATYTVGEAGPTATITITRTGGTDGAVTVDYATVAGGTATGGASCAPGIDYVNTNGTAMFADGSSVSQTFNVQICQDTTFKVDETINLALSNATGGATIGSPSTAVLTITNDDTPPLSGVIDVGTGQTYTSLTNTGGLFAAINAAGASSNLTINITSDLTGETGTVPLTEIAGGFTVLIRPTGAPRLITGASTTGLLKFSGADGVTIDGSLTGATSAQVLGGDDSIRNLTIQNTSTTATAGAVVSVLQGTNGANNFTIKNVKVLGQDPTQTLLGISIAGAAPGSTPTIANNNGRIENCSVRRAILGTFYNGVSAAAPGTGAVITLNDLTGTGADRLRRGGLFFFNQNGIQVTLNDIGGIDSNESADSIGIIAGNQGVSATVTTSGGVTNANISRNRINGVRASSTVGFSAVGISIAGGTTGPNTISNNMISGVIGPATSPDIVAGIFVVGAASSDTRLYFNSIANTGDRGAVASQIGSYGVAITGVNPVVDMKDNIFYNTQISGGGANAKSYSIGLVSTTFTNFNSNYNDFFASGANAGFFRTGGLGATATDHATLAAFQTATTSNANSQEVDPLYVNAASNLHLQAASPILDDGTPAGGITVDFDGETRSATPDIGADEVAAVAMPGVLQFSAATYSIGEAGPLATITITRTGGSDGMVGVDFATSDGTATGGGCGGPGVDYSTTSGTRTWADGDTANKTFTIPICNDTTDEPDETVNLTLTNPTGGGTIGTQSTAVLTITDDDLPPGSFSINDVRLFEGNAGAVNAVFTISYTGPVVPVSVQYATANGTAVAGTDYLSAGGTVTFNSAAAPEGGPQTQTIIVVVNSDVVKEANETYFVNLSSPTGATIADGQGVGIIIDEDRPYVADFDLDHVSDYSVYRPSEGRWYSRLSTSATAEIFDFGVSTDIAVPGDYDGDGITDYALWRPSTGEWYRALSATSTKVVSTWGTTGDKPVQGDFDGDGKADLAIYRPSTGFWWILRSSTGTSIAVPFGISTDRPVQGDYDGDFKTDIAVYRDGTWYINRSSDAVVQVSNWGLASDKPVSGDFDGDGKYDLAIYRDGAWWVLNSLTGSSFVTALGLATDVPAPADFDGDGTTDTAVFRPSTGDWHVRLSSNGAITGVHWGVANDVPVPKAYLPQ